VRVPPLQAEAANGHVHVTLRAEPPVALHDEQFWRADGNNPMRVERDGVTVFLSDYEPRGRTFRRRVSLLLCFERNRSRAPHPANPPTCALVRVYCLRLRRLMALLPFCCFFSKLAPLECSHLHQSVHRPVPFNRPSLQCSFTLAMT